MMVVGRIFFFSFSYGILSHFLLRDNNDQYLRETKKVAKEEVGDVHLAAFSYLRGLLLEGQRYLEILGGG